MDWFKYVDILEESLLGTLRDQKLKKKAIIFQHDNDPKHTLRYTNQWLRKKRICLLPWAAWSPDINIIKYVWNEIKRHVRKRHPLPMNKWSLWNTFKEEWDNLKISFINKLYKSIPVRIA